MGKGWGLGGTAVDHSHFAIGEERIAVVGCAADDDVVEETDVEDFRGIVEAMSEFGICSAWAGIAGGMIVNENESPGVMEEAGAKDIARVSGRFGEGATGDFDRAEVLEAGIDHGEEEFFLGEVSQLGGEGLVDALWGIERPLIHAFSSEAGAKFKGGGELAGFGEAEAGAVLEAAEAGGAEPMEGAEVTEDITADFDGAFAFDPGAKEQGDELRIVEGGRAETGKLFPGALVAGQVANQIHGRGGGFYLKLIPP